MSPEDRFRKLSVDFPLPWQIVCQYVAGDYIPTKILDRDGKTVMECAWGAGTPEGKHLYSCIVEAAKDRIDYGNPWNNVPRSGREIA